MRGLPRQGVVAALSAVLVLNLLAWLGLWAGGGAVLGTGMMAYLLGMRHAFDADHIAAIDNVTRRLLAAGDRPAGIGLFFSLGHSSVVLLMVALVAGAVHHANALLEQLSAWGAWLGGLVSAVFLSYIGLANLRLLPALLQGRAVAPHPGFAARLAGRMVDRSWKMAPLGALFGLGFDTASEIALLALSMTAARGLASPWEVMLLPLQFAAGMALMDTVESLLMLRAYVWAIDDRDRSLRFNTVITTLSVVLALGVAGHEWAGLAGARAGLSSVTGMDSSALGFLVSASLLAIWLLAVMRRHRQDLLATPGPQ